MRKMRINFGASIVALLLTLAFLSGGREAFAAFESGSTCGAVFYNSTTCRGAFSPTVNTQVDLPPNGILDYTTVNIPSGVTVSFKKNAANTPVIIRTSGNVTVAGTIWVGYTTNPTKTGTSGDGVLGDDGQPGTGGPGGFDGGPGGLGPSLGDDDGAPGCGGKGHGGGQPGASRYTNTGDGAGGGGGGYNGNGANSASNFGVGGAGYGQGSLLPLVGGSGGGGGAAGITFSGAGGGGGGGAILIASSGTIYVTGYIYANGGDGASSAGTYSGGGGGGGSGGAIKLMAEKLDRGSVNNLYALGGGGGGGADGYYGNSGGAGTPGYIRLESNVLTNWSTGNSNPGYDYHKLTEAGAGKIFVPKNPKLSITNVSGTAVPANPTGVGDITLPEGATSATVQLAATDIPKGTTVTVFVTPNGGVRTSVLSTALDGASDAATTATATVTLKPGNNVLLATATYTVTELIAMSLPRFNGEYVAKIRIDSAMDGASQVTYITASGKEYGADGKPRNVAS